MPALIVGAGPGMGRAIAAALGPSDGPVALIARRVESLAALETDLAAVSVTAQGFRADIAEEQQLRRAIEAARSALGPFRVVVFNASQFVPGPPSAIPLDDFRAGMAAGVTAAIITVQATVDDLRHAKPEGCLLFTGGGLATNPWPPGIGLAIQKAGLRHFAIATAEELRPEVAVSIVTIRGTIQAGGPFDQARIASVFADLAVPGRDGPVEVTYTETGPDWTPPEA